MRSWKSFNTIRRASPKIVPPEHAMYAARKLTLFIDGGDTLSKKVMEDLSSEERRSVVEESSSMVLYLPKREGLGVHGQALSERARRLSERELQTGLNAVGEQYTKWLSQALKGSGTVKGIPRLTCCVWRNVAPKNGNVSGAVKTQSGVPQGHKWRSCIARSACRGSS